MVIVSIESYLLQTGSTIGMLIADLKAACVYSMTSLVVLPQCVVFRKHTDTAVLEPEFKFAIIGDWRKIELVERTSENI
jgi:hypothetical protein